MRPRSALSVLAFAAALGAFPGLPAAAQQIPADPVLRDFEPYGEYVLEVGGKPLSGLKLFRSQKAGSAVLIMGTGIPSPLLVMPRERVVNRVPANKVVVGMDNVAYVLADARPVRESAFAVEGRDLIFTVGGTPSRLREKPHLLGLHPGTDLKSHDWGYAFRSHRYTPSAPVVASLRQVRTPVRVRVYFGSWCPHCSTTVPKILKLADALAGTPVQFEYYGLPMGFGNEPEAKRMNIEAVPTGVVFRDGREVGRVSGHEWGIPELALKKVLDRTAATPARSR
jgi:thiol-disulfide isomerase/thioredoxin